MANIKGPLFGLEASGSIGGCLTYQKNHSGNTVKGLRFLKLKDTPARLIVRQRFAWAYTMWLALNDLTKELWNNWYDDNGLTGWLAFSSQFQRRTALGVAQFQIPPYYGYCACGEFLCGEFLCGGDFIPPPV